MSKQNEIVDLELYKHFVTERAIRVSKDGNDKEGVWLPLSQVEVAPVKGSIVLVTTPTWLAIDKGLI